MTQKIDQKLVKHIAQLAQIPITDQEEKELATAFSETLQVINDLKEVEVEGIEPTHQVTGLENVTRPDQVNSELMFTQKEALANAKKTHQGYFVVERVIDVE